LLRWPTKVYYLPPTVYVTNSTAGTSPSLNSLYRGLCPTFPGEIRGQFWIGPIVTVNAHAAKIMVLEDDHGLADVVASLFKQENAPRVLILSMPGAVATRLLEFTGYHTSLLTGREAVELAQKTPSAVIMLDGAVLNLILKDLRPRPDMPLALAASAEEPDVLVVEDDERAPDLREQKIQLQQALARAERLIQTLGEIARGSLRAVEQAE
jgi:CheY-like chemotaxis protein